MREVSTTVCGGFPVTVTGNITPPDRSLGYYTAEAEIIEIGYYAHNGRWKRLPFIERKMTEADFDRCREALIERN